MLTALVLGASMAVLGRLTGIGSVRVAGEVFGGVAYELVVTKNGPLGSTGGRGTLRAKPSEIFQMFDVNDGLVLELANGEGEVSFSVERTDMQSARVVLNGPVPGFG
jgi:hypothetical protein